MMYRRELRWVEPGDHIKFHWWGRWWTVLDRPRVSSEPRPHGIEARYTIKVREGYDKLSNLEYTGVFEDAIHSAVIGTEKRPVMVWGEGRNPSRSVIGRLYPVNMEIA